MAAAATDENPFQVLGLEPSYALAQEALRNALLRESLRWHPDRWVTRVAAERRAAEDRMAAVNHAYTALADPIGRAEALLAQAGAPMPRGTDHVSCPGALLAMMELKEELADGRAAGDPARMKAAAQNLAEQEQSSLAELAAAFASWEAAGMPTEKARELHARLAEATYLRRTATGLAAETVVIAEM